MLLEVSIPSTLFCYNCQKVYCETRNYDYVALKFSEQIQDSIEIIIFYAVRVQDHSKIKFCMMGQRTSCFFVFRILDVQCGFDLTVPKFSSNNNNFQAILLYASPSGNQIDGVPLGIHT